MSQLMTAGDEERELLRASLTVQTNRSKEEDPRGTVCIRLEPIKSDEARHGFGFRVHMPDKGRVRGSIRAREQSVISAYPNFARTKYENHSVILTRSGRT